MCTMRDTCGSINAGVASLGMLYPESRLDSSRFQVMCSEYYRRIEETLFTPDCAVVHGDKTAKSENKKLEEGVTKKCFSLVATGSQKILELRRAADDGDFRFMDNHDVKSIEKISKYFSDHSFHCCKSVLDKVSAISGMAVEDLYNACRGFCGGIGFNGTVCGAIVGGIFCLGLYHSVDLQKSTYLYTMRVTLGKMLRGNKVFEDERFFKPADLYRDGRRLYSQVKTKYGGAHCREILKIDLAASSGCAEFIDKSKIRLCQRIVNEVADTVVLMVANG
jgi:hypothetical protein